MIATTPIVVRKRKATLQPVKMEDIKIEFVDLCVAVPSPEATVFPILELESNGVATTASTVLASPPLTPMEVTFSSTVSDEMEDTDFDAESGSGDGGVKAPRKRRKLDHLSPEEKSQHRKMMNRMSAQSARDRQKSLMQLQDVKIKALNQAADTMKKQNSVLTSKNETLNIENATLKAENTRLSQLVRELEVKLQSVPQQQQMQFGNLSGIVKQEVEEYTDEEVVSVVFESVANEDEATSGKCSSGSSPSEPAEGIIRGTTSTSPQLDLSSSTAAAQTQQQQQPSSDSSSLDVVPWDLDSPEILQILGEFSEQILSGDQQLREELEQAENIIGQMVANAQSQQQQQPISNSGYSGENGIDITFEIADTAINNAIEKLAKKQQQQDGNYGSQQNSTKIPPVAPLALPLEEPQTLEFAQINFSAISPLPVAAPVIAFDIQQSVEKGQEQSSQKKTYFEESDLYDSYWSPDVELFPELF